MCKECKEQAEQIKTAITLIKTELKRLGVSIENDFYYGLMVEPYTRWDVNGQLQGLIRVFDDSESVVYFKGRQAS